MSTEREELAEAARVELAGAIHRAIPNEWMGEPTDLGYLCEDDECLWYDIADHLITLGYHERRQPMSNERKELDELERDLFANLDKVQIITSGTPKALIDTRGIAEALHRLGYRKQENWRGI